MDAGKGSAVGEPDRADAVPADRHDHRERAASWAGGPCLRSIGLEKRFGAEGLEGAALRALDIRAGNYRSVTSIHEEGLDHLPVQTPPEREPILRGNIRGSGYYL